MAWTQILHRKKSIPNNQTSSLLISQSFFGLHLVYQLSDSSAACSIGSRGIPLVGSGKLRSSTLIIYSVSLNLSLLPSSTLSPAICFLSYVPKVSTIGSLFRLMFHLLKGHSAVQIKSLSIALLMPWYIIFRPDWCVLLISPTAKPVRTHCRSYESGLLAGWRIVAVQKRVIDPESHSSLCIRKELPLGTRGFEYLSYIPNCWGDRSEMKGHHSALSNGLILVWSHTSWFLILDSWFFSPTCGLPLLGLVLSKATVEYLWKVIWSRDIPATSPDPDTVFRLYSRPETEHEEHQDLLAKYERSTKSH